LSYQSARIPGPDARLRQRRAKAATACLVAAAVAGLSGCAKASPGTAVPAVGASPAATSPAMTRPADPVHPAATAVGFTVAGNRAVAPNGSQDTHAATPAARCNRTTFAADRAVAGRVAAGFELAGFSAAAGLMRHFLAGTGRAVAYPAGSAVSRQARASSPFRELNSAVQRVVLAQLRAGKAQVELPAAQLPLVAFESSTSDLYWGFRGTQGLTVTGRGTREHGRYVGTLSYVIRDSYGFPAGDTLGGFGPPMRYLQTVCGAPENPDGARWFPDSITVTVPFSRAA
jgi:hypothetical protein